MARAWAQARERARADAPRAAGQRFEALDSLRGICAVCVALFHFQTVGLIHNSALIRHSYMFVDFFFVLSGFVIASSYGAKLAAGFPIGRFMLLRLGRLYPLHLAVLLLFLGTLLGGQLVSPGLTFRSLGQGESGWPEFAYGLGFVQIFLGTEETWYNAPSWSISAEVWTYLIAAAAFGLCRGRVLLGMGLLSALSFAIYAAASRHGVNDHHWAAVPRCLFSFGLGVCGWQLHARRAGPAAGTWARPAAGTLVELGALALALALVVLNWSLAGPFGFLLMVMVFAREAGQASRWLTHRWMLRLGLLSYSIYMVHAFVEARVMGAVAALQWWLGRDDLVLALPQGPTLGIGVAAADGVTVATVALVVAVASLTYRFIERPGQRWSRGLILGEQPRPVVARAEREAPTF